LFPLLCDAELFGGGLVLDAAVHTSPYLYKLTANKGPCTESYSGLYAPDPMGRHVSNE